MHARSHTAHKAHACSTCASAAPSRQGSAGSGRFCKKAYQHLNFNARFTHFRKSGKARIEPVFAGLPIDRLVVGPGLPAKLIDRVDNLLDPPHLGPMNPIVAVRVGISRSAHLMAQSLDVARAVLLQPAATIKGALFLFASCLAAQQSARTRPVRSGPSTAQASGATSQTNGPYSEALAW